MPSLIGPAFCLTLALAAGCEATSQTQAGRASSAEPLAAYAGNMRRLFDDEFGGLALGTPWNDSLADQNALLSKRALSASSILVCTVGTVTEGSGGDNIAALLELRSPGQSLIVADSNECPKIPVAATSFSYSILRQSGASLVGKSVVIFVRNFHENGGTTWHWHVEPDRPDVRATIQRMRGQ